MRISASTLAIEWARKADRKYGPLLDSQNMDRKELMEIAFFAGYRLAEEKWKKRIREERKKTK